MTMQARPTATAKSAPAWAEIERAKTLHGLEGTFVLAEVLRELGVGYVTDLTRRCATADARFEAAWASNQTSHSTSTV